MARINWKKKYKLLTESLHSGKSVAETALLLEVSYSTFCKFLSSVSLDNKGHFKKPIKNTPQLEDYFSSFIIKEFKQLQEICEAFQVSSSQVQTMMRNYTLTKEWDLANSSSENVAIGRTAELFVKEQSEFKVVADMIKKDSKAPYDMVIAGYGAVDVKATKLRTTPSGGHRYKFNVANITKPTKFAFCVGYNEDYSKPEVLLIVPYKFLKGKQSLSVSKEKLMESKYKEFVHKIYYTEDIPQEDNLS